MRDPEATIEVARLVRAPVDHVWQVFTDLSARSQVMSTVDSVEILSGNGFDVGTTWRETRTLPDTEPVVEELTVEALEPPHRCLIFAHGDEGDYRLDYRFQPRNGDTQMRVQFSTPLPDRFTTRVLAVLFGELVTRVIEGGLRHDLDDLADAVESAAA
jgi:uncharacterized membrane protein